MARTDNDTWDLANSVGATATMVAAARAIATRAENPLIDDRFADPLVRAVGVDFFARWATGELDAADLDDSESAWRLEHMPDAMAARTRYFDSFFLDATRAGIRQAVILASGLDARAFRLAWPADMTVFEVDQPRVIEFKSTTLAGLRAVPTAELRTVSVDLRHDWPSALRNAGLDSDRPTAWIAEGLFGYLPPEAQDHLLDNITALSADGSQLVAEVFFSAPVSRELYDAIFARWYEHGLDVEMDRLGYPGGRSDVATYLEQRNWRVARTPLNELLLANGFRPHSVHNSTDEALFTENYYCTAVLHRDIPGR